MEYVRFTRAKFERWAQRRKMTDALIETENVNTSWDALARRILAGHRLMPAEGLEILRSSDSELPALLAAAFRVRLRHFGRKVHLYYLKNAKSGLCPEDCGYCSQSSVADSAIDRYPLLNEAKLLDGPGKRPRCRRGPIASWHRGGDRRIGK